jgi:hypothetical protein
MEYPAILRAIDADRQAPSGADSPRGHSGVGTSHRWHVPEKAICEEVSSSSTSGCRANRVRYPGHEHPFDADDKGNISKHTRTDGHGVTSKAKERVPSHYQAGRSGTASAFCAALQRSGSVHGTKQLAEGVLDCVCEPVGFSRKPGGGDAPESVGGLAGRPARRAIWQLEHLFARPRDHLPIPVDVSFKSALNATSSETDRNGQRPVIWKNRKSGVANAACAVPKSGRIRWLRRPQNPGMHVGPC